MKTIIQNKNILALFSVGFFRNFLIMMPVLTLYFKSKGLTMSEIMLLQTIFSVAIVVLEVPSGYFADLFKRKYSLILGMLFFFIGSLGFYLSNGFWGFVIMEILFAISTSFLSGADGAYLYDELLSKKQEKKYQEIDGKYTSVLRFSEAIASFVAGFLASISFKFVVFGQIIMSFLGLISSLFLKEHKKNRKKEDKLKMKDVFKFILKENKNIKYLILFASMLGSSTLIFVWLGQPFWKELGLPMAYFGIVWGILNLLVGIFALFAHKLEKKFKFKTIFIFFWICSFIFYILLYFTKNIYLALIISSGFWIFRGLNGPIIKDYINREVSSKMRATVLSIQSLVFRIVFSILSPFVGYFADIYDLRTTLLLTGIIFMILSGIFLSLLFIGRSENK